jgi:dienelactone hydrolase
MILESKDFRRSIDYLVSRTDVDRNRLGVYGFSRGCHWYRFSRQASFA